MFPIFLIMTTGRTGSDYLQGCLDNLNGVMTFCGKFEYHSFFKKNKIRDNVDLINEFIKKNKKLFSYDEIEDIDTNVDTEKFKNIYLKTSNVKNIDQINFFINIYQAYHLTVNRDLKNVKALVHHSHSLENTKKCLQDFPDAKLLITIRDPRANLKSGLENWFNYDFTRRNMQHYYLYLKRIRDDLKFALKIQNEKLFIKLEESGNSSTKKIICNFLKIKYDNKIEVATFNSVPWKGDSLSPSKSQAGRFNEGIKNNNWDKYFSNKEITILNLIYNDYNKFGYNIPKFKKFEKFKILLSIFSFSIFNIFKMKIYNRLIFKNIFYLIKVRLYLFSSIVLSK